MNTIPSEGGVVGSGYRGVRLAGVTDQTAKGATLYMLSLTCEQRLHVLTGWLVVGKAKQVVGWGEAVLCSVSCPSPVLLHLLHSHAEGGCSLNIYNHTLQAD